MLSVAPQLPGDRDRLPAQTGIAHSDGSGAPVSEFDDEDVAAVTTAVRQDPLASRRLEERAFMMDGDCDYGGVPRVALVETLEADPDEFIAIAGIGTLERLADGPGVDNWISSGRAGAKDEAPQEREYEHPHVCSKRARRRTSQPGGSETDTADPCGSAADCLREIEPAFVQGTTHDRPRASDRADCADVRDGRNTARCDDPALAESDQSCQQIEVRAPE